MEVSNKLACKLRTNKVGSLKHSKAREKILGVLVSIEVTARDS
jgi:hypothetical protein